ncbi:MAG: M81 family metallopeptidase, partial [Bacteroidales bacterium]
MKKTLSICLSMLLLLSCNSGNSSKKDAFKIGIATFSHETCTFCPRPTGIDEFEYYGPPLTGDEVLNADSYINGFVSRAGEYGGVKLEG